MCRIFFRRFAGEFSRGFDGESERSTNHEGPLTERLDALTPAADAVARESVPARELATLLEQTVERRDALTTERDGLVAALPDLAAAHADAERGLAATRAEAAGLDSLETTALVVRGRLAALDEVEAGRERVRVLTPRLLAAGDARLAHQQVLLDLRRRRLDQMAAELAGALVEGEPCPVCGALEHPAAAVTADPVTPAALAAAEQALAAAETAYTDVERDVRDLEAAVRTRLEDLAGADRESLTADLAAAEAAAEQARVARSRLPAAEAGCAQRRGAVDDAALRHATLVATVDELDTRAEEVRAEADAARERLSAALEAHAGCPCGAADPAAHRGVVERLTVLVRAEGDLGAARERLEAAERRRPPG